jgi:hypothetical protein
MVELSLFNINIMVGISGIMAMAVAITFACNMVVIIRLSASMALAVDITIADMSQDKNNFIIHYRNRHFNFSITTGLSSPTAYHARQYQTDLLYNFCLAHPNTTTKPSQSHLTKDWKSFPNLTSSDSLAKLLAQKLNLNPSGTSTPGTSSSSSDSSTADRDALAVALVSSGILEDKKKGKKH